MPAVGYVLAFVAAYSPIQLMSKNMNRDSDMDIIRHCGTGHTYLLGYWSLGPRTGPDTQL